jgi:hypothetical protein
LDDQTWGELLEVLDAHELSLVADACGGDDLDGDENEPITPAPQHAPQEAHSWHAAFPVHTHSLSWVDGDGISHSHTVRSDDIDDVLRQVKTIKVVIAAAKAHNTKVQGVDTKEPGSLSPRRCAIHDAEMTRRTSKKTGKLYSAHDTAEGLCFGRKA